MRHGITTPWGLLGVCALMALSALSAHAQDSGTVRGIVTTAAGEPVPEGLALLGSFAHTMDAVDFSVIADAAADR
ncbi:MAG TPA: hypothetical protein EYQ83_08630, partial [Acidobacteria bacterium]|nr:hypothetical protein [Acidobacteriota bacterium]